MMMMFEGVVEAFLMKKKYVLPVSLLLTSVK